MGILIITVSYLFIFFTNYSESEIVVSNRDPQTLENIYLNYLANRRESTENAFDTLISKEKLMSLCQQIFQLNHYRLMNFHLNKAAYYFVKKTFLHEENPVIIFKKLFFYGEKATQKMYPCYGRHNPVQTSYRIDDFYDRVFISAGLDDQSIIVYHHRKLFENDSYTLLDYLQNIELRNISNINIDAAQIRDELTLTDRMFLTYIPKEVESIYVREQNLSITDPLCKFSKKKLTSLCEFIFSMPFYKNHFKVKLNWSATLTYPITCNDKYLKFHFWPRFKYREITQKMIPCYGIHELAPPDSALFDNTNSYLMRYQISSGPRPNSILIYVLENNSTYRVLNMIENIQMNYIRDTDVDARKIQRESPNIKYYLALHHRLSVVEKMNKLFHQNILSVQNLPDNIQQSTKEIQNLFLVDIRNTQLLVNYFREIDDCNSFKPYMSLQEMQNDMKNRIKHLSLINKWSKITLELRALFDTVIKHVVITSYWEEVEFMHKTQDEECVKKTEKMKQEMIKAEEEAP